MGKEKENMKSNKTKVLEFFLKYSSNHEFEKCPKFTTQYLSENLSMQRTNLSSILNQLVRDGDIIKINGRPVLYQLSEEKCIKKDEFEALIGWDSSLKEAVMLAKAAILYPQSNPHILLSAESGSGVEYFTKIMYNFAVKSRVLKNGAPFIVVDCKTFFDNSEDLHKVLFGSKNNDGAIHEADQGLLLIKNVELLPGIEKKDLFNYINATKHISSLGNMVRLSKDYKCIVVCSVSGNTNFDVLNLYRNKMDYTIEILPFCQKSIKERYNFLVKFLKEEAKKLNRQLIVTTNILHSLLLYDVKGSVRGFKNDLHTGCANGYVRLHAENHHNIELLLSDFPNYVRKGMIYYKNHREEIDKLISTDCRYTFSKNEVLKSTIKNKKIDFYHSIDTKKKELKKANVSETEIENIISAQLQSEFDKYFNDLSNRIGSKVGLKKIVSSKLIDLVDEFMYEVESKIGTCQNEKIFFVLCLHLNSALIKTSTKQRVTNEMVKKLMDNYPQQFQIVKNFISKIENEFKVKFDVDETIVILLIILKMRKINNVPKVATLIAMHGDGAAASIVKVVNSLSKEKNVYAYDLLLDKDMESVYDEFKQLILKVNCEKGILLIYDMGSIRIMAESISSETGISIKCLEMPIPLIGLTSSNMASDEKNLDDIYDYLQENFKYIQYTRTSSNKEIIVIISSDDVEEIKVKSYLQANFELDHIDLVAIKIQEDIELYNEINQISNKGKIIGIISNERKNLAQYPYINIDNLLNGNYHSFEELLAQPNKENYDDELNDIFDYLKEQFTSLKIDDMKSYFIKFVDQLALIDGVGLNNDTKIGLIVHLVCLVDRILNHKTPAVNFMAYTILKKYENLVSIIRSLLISIEEAFDIKINDVEIATIISIIKKDK